MHVDVLIKKVLANKASEKEARELNQWTSETIHNKFELADIKLLYQSVDDTLSTDTDDRFEKIKDAIEAWEDTGRQITILTTYSAFNMIVVIGIIGFLLIQGYLLQVKPGLNDGSDVTNSKRLELVTSLSFRESTLGSVLEKLKTQFGVEFEVDNEKILSSTFTGMFYKGSSLDDILRVMAKTNPFNYKRLSNNKYLILNGN